MGVIKMSAKYKVLVSILVVLTSFAAGRYSLPEKLKVETISEEKDKKVLQMDTDRDKHKETTTVEVVKPDGTKETTTKTVEDDNTKKKTNETEASKTDKTETKEITYSSSKVTVSAIAGVTPFSLSPSVVYGGSVTKPILGPITSGVWFLTNGTIGASVGLTF